MSKTVALTLSGFEPTADELARAREVIKASGEAGKRAKMESMAGFIRRNKDTDKGLDLAAQSRGDQRWQWCEKYIAFQMRKGQGQSKNQQHQSELQQQKRETQRLTEFQLRQTYGDEMVGRWPKKKTQQP